MKFKNKKNRTVLLFFLLIPIVNIGCQDSYNNNAKQTQPVFKGSEDEAISYEYNNQDSIIGVFKSAYEEIPIIGEYFGLRLDNDAIFERKESDIDPELRILKDDLYGGFLIMQREAGQLKNKCDNPQEKYIYNKRAYFIFNYNYSKVCVVYQSRYNEKVNVLETPFDIFSIDEDCFLLLRKGVFDGEDFNGENIKKAFMIAK